VTVAGFTSTGSKKPGTLFGGDADFDVLPMRMSWSGGCRIRDAESREYLDFIMALGAVGLGYNHPEVNQAAIEAIQNGTVGPLAPVEEELLGSELQRVMPHLEQVRFFKTGAEAVAAAVRLARAATQRDLVLGAGYHGWLDWCSTEPGVPTMVQALYQPIRFNDSQQAVEQIRAAGDALACVVVEPVIDREPDPEWLRVVREECTRFGAFLIFDEVKTAFRVATGGAAERWGGNPDLVVLGKALANGFPLAAVGGRGDLMELVNRTWISSTLATEFVSLAAARATLRVMAEMGLVSRLAATGRRLYQGLQQLAGRFPAVISEVRGIPEMCYLSYHNPAHGHHAAQLAAHRGVLFKRDAYNFISLAHQTGDVDRAIGILGEVMEVLGR
jgi:glutamate-1-semialdehyde aminotransferase